MVQKCTSPVVEKGITWQTERMGSPGELKFSVVKDDVINFTEGNTVRLRVDGKNVFMGLYSPRKEIRMESLISPLMTN